MIDGFGMQFLNGRSWTAFTVHWLFVHSFRQFRHDAPDSLVGMSVARCIAEHAIATRSAAFARTFECDAAHGGGLCHYSRIVVLIMGLAVLL